MTAPAITRARPRTRAMPWGLLLSIAALALAVAVGIAAWWSNGGWRPDRAAFPVQGVRVDPGPDTAAGAKAKAQAQADSAPDTPPGQPSWRGIATSGADFAYVMATSGADGVTPAIDRHLSQARAAGLPTGPVHRFSLCDPAGDQAENFIRHVAREAAALPTAVWLETLDEAAATGPAPACARPPSRAALLSELATFLAQIEAHGGKPAVIAPSDAFEQAYGVTRRINRAIWLRRDWFRPDYGAAPFVLWEATDRARIPGIDRPVGWIAAAPGTPS